MNKIIITILILSLTLPLLASKASDDYSVLSKEYHKFFKSKKNRSQWLLLIKKFENHGKKYKTNKISAKSFYNVANLSYKIFKISHRQSDLNRALKTYKKICLNYKSSFLADDSCMFLYQFYFKKTKNYEKSKFFANFILDNYKNSDNYSAANKFMHKHFPNSLKPIKEDQKLKVVRHKLLDITFYKDKLIVKMKSKHNETAKIGEVKVDGDLKKVFVDLKNEHFAKLKAININFILEKIRFGQYKNNVGRIVFDFKDKAKYKVLDRGKTLLISFKNDNKKLNEIKTKEIIKVVDKPKVKVVKNLSQNKSKEKLNSIEVVKKTKDVEKKTKVVLTKKPNINKDSKTKKYKIIIDPGHGGKDPGAHKNKYYEKDIALKVALKLEKRLKKNKKYKVILTRRTDKYLSLDQRTDIANDNNGDIFISIHVNAIANKKFYGIETFYLNIAADNYSRRLESVENAENQKKITDLQFILADLLKKANTKESIDLASFVQSSLIFNLRRKYKNIKNLGVKNAMFYVLLDTKMPSVLVEIGFITNKKDFKRLINDKYQDRLAISIEKGIDKFFSKYKKTK